MKRPGRRDLVFLVWFFTALYAAYVYGNTRGRFAMAQVCREGLGRIEAAMTRARAARR